MLSHLSCSQEHPQGREAEGVAGFPRPKEEPSGIGSWIFAEGRGAIDQPQGQGYFQG